MGILEAIRPIVQRRAAATRPRIAQKSYSLMASLFKTNILTFLDIAQKQKQHFLKPDIKLVQKHFFIRKYQFEKFDFLTRG